MLFRSDSFNNINELTNEDGRIVRANFSLKLQGYIVPDTLQKKLKEQNTRYFSKAQIILNQATTVIDEPSKRATTLKSVRGGAGGGGSVQTINNITNNTGVATDSDWNIEGDLLINNNNRSVSIQNAKLLINAGTATSDIFIIQRDTDVKLKVNNDGILIFKEFTDDNKPSPIEGGIIYIDDQFYLGT